MAIRKIEYAVDVGGINPKTRQEGGVQGDHNVTELEFSLSDRLYERLKNEADLVSGAKLCYRIDRYNGEGDCEATAAQELESKVIVFAVDEWMTRYGGIVKAVLVFSLEGEEFTEIELFSFPAVLTLKTRPSTLLENREKYRSLSNMSIAASDSAKSAADNAERVETLAKEALASAQSAENFAERLKDAEIIFKSDLDDEGGRLPIEFEVDDFLSDISENPVKNRIINAALINLRNDFQQMLDNIKSDLVLSAHPIGSYYWSQSNTNPALLFGGEWERVKDKFVLAAGDDYEEGTVGGASETVLLEENLPKNYYFGTTYGNSEYGVQRTEILVDSSNKSDRYAFVGAPNATNADESGLKWIFGHAQPIDNMPPYIAAYCWRRIA